MKSTKQDMERLIALHPYTNPASVPVEYTLGDRHYCGFPGEFHPVAETRRVDANLYECEKLGVEMKPQRDLKA